MPSLNSGFGPLISGPQEPLAQRFSTALGTIVGTLDGVNRAFTTGVALKRGEVYRNGVLQTEGVDCVVSGKSIVFLAGHEPQAGDTIECFGNPGV